MNKEAVSKAFNALDKIAPGVVKIIEFKEQLRSANDLNNMSIIGYHVDLTVFYKDTNFTVSVYAWDDDLTQDYDTLTKMAIEKLKQIANEKAR